MPEQTRAGPEPRRRRKPADRPVPAPLRLLLVRHGIAEPAGAGRPDAERRLTARGARRLRRSVAGLQRAGCTLDHLLHSPWRRAAQSAEIVATLLVDAEARSPGPCAALAQEPGAALLKLLVELASTGGRPVVALVGHEPWLTQLAAWLAGLTPQAQGGLDLRKGGVIVLEGLPQPAGMQLTALLAPRWLRHLRD